MRVVFPSFTLNQLGRTELAISRALQRLSSGHRINSPADDVGGFSMSTTLDTQARGYTQAILNLNQGVGILETAQGAYETQTSLMQKMRELAVQASNGTLSTSDRANLNTEFQALLSEYERITASTQFNGIPLLDGSVGTVMIQAGPRQGDTIPLDTALRSSNSVIPLGTTTATLPYTQTTTVTVTTTTTTTVGTGTFQAAKTFAAYASGVVAMAFGDFNGDGKMDLVESDSNNSKIAVRLGNGDGTFAAATQAWANAGNTGDVKVGDINGDGKLDILYQISNSTIYALIGNGDGTFSGPTAVAGGIGTYSTIGLADMNGDGKLDIVGSDGTNKQIDTSVGNGDGTFKAPSIYTSNGYLITSFALGDLNGDGKLDVVEVSNQNADLQVIVGNGDGTLGAETNLVAGNNPQYVTLADVNGDGKLDIIDKDANDNTVSVFLNNGDGTFQARHTFAVGVNTLNTQQVFVTDVNGDGKLDIVTADYSDGTVSTLLGNGDGTFQARTTIAVSSPEMVTFKDVNGDGVPDMIVSNNTGSPYVSTYLANTTVTTTTSTSTSVTTLTTTTTTVSFNLTTQFNAEYTTSAIDTALQFILSQAALVGGSLDRLHSALDYSSMMIQNLDDARSQIVDADYAVETANLVRLQILQQAQVAATTQANLENQLVAKLLNF